MGLDSETQMALAEELEDVAMELANISTLPLETEKDSEAFVLQATLAETQRLNDIVELYDAQEIIPITAWVHQNIQDISTHKQLFNQQNEAGFYYTWLELLSASLREHDAELLAELSTVLRDTGWHTALPTSDLQVLLVFLSQPLTEPESVVAPTSSDTLIAKENIADYELAWDEDVHPELLEAFFIETPDQVIEVAGLIRLISEGNVDNDTYQSAARIAHTVKGASAVVGITAVATFAHRLEDILEYSIDKGLPQEVSELLVESSDCLEEMFDSLLMQTPPPTQYTELLDQLTDWDKKFAEGYVHKAEEIPTQTLSDPLSQPAQREKIAPPPASPKSTYTLAWDKDVHPELLEAYMSETPEHVADLAQLLRAISQGSADKKSYVTASRLSHTIKGTSAVVGIDSVAKFGGQLEEILDHGNESGLPNSLLPLLDDVADLLESLYDSLLSEGTPPEEYPVIYQQLCQWKQHIESPSEEKQLTDTSTKEVKKAVVAEPKVAQKPPFASKVEPDVPKEIVEYQKELRRESTGRSSTVSKKKNDLFHIDLPPLQKILPPEPIAPLIPKKVLIQRASLTEATLRVPVSLIDKLLRFSSELITTNTQISDEVNLLLKERHVLSERNDRIRNMLDELEWAIDQQTALNTKQSKAIQKNSTFDSLEMDSYNELHGIAGLLSESINDDREMALSVTQQLNKLKGQAHHQTQLNKALNSTVLSMRMEEVKILSPRLERIIRETCRRTKKKAKLQITGDHLAIDTDIIKGLVDPLLHLLRNAVDHGIELPTVRKEHGKNEQGTIQLSFTQEGDQVILTLRDDGAGIDPNKIYEIALKKGLIEANDRLSKNDVLRLILHPGFSTRTEVTEISGRGVGMDVVNTAIKNMSGNITIKSNKNKGSEIRLQVPLTLSSANIILVKTLGNTLAIPNTNIQRIHYLPTDSVIHYEHELFINYQKKKIPLLDLSILLGWSTTTLNTNKSQAILIVEHHQQYYALYVDEILKPQEITLKSLKPWITEIAGINGVCLLPSGVVAPVLNLFELLDVEKNHAAPTVDNKDKATQLGTEHTILVVDDSLSNRKALSLMLQALGHTVATAIDGIDALQKLEKSIFKLVITDLEMPHMNGLELAESLRSWSVTKGMPIVMVTSRSTQKHYDLAKQAGVDKYLTKPVDSNTLESTVNYYLGTKP